jgi:hypothetical protein
MHIIGSDAFANLLSLAGILLVVIGMFGLGEFAKSHEKQRHDASFGYYTNLDCFLECIKALILDDEGNSIGVLALFSPNEEYRCLRTPDPIKKSGRRLSKIAGDLLKYISTEKNLIPPCNDILETENWYKKFKVLVKHLNYFLLLNDDFRNPAVYDKETEAEYCRSIVGLIDDIQTILKHAIDEYVAKCSK